MRHINVKEILSNQFENGKFCKYDIIIRYMFIREYYRKNKPELFRHKLYSILAKARDTKDRSKKFLRLIQSFEENGFDESYPIEMSGNFYICGATHRVALCLYFGIEEVPYKINDSCKRKRRRFTKSWLKKNGFKKHIESIEKTKNKLFKKLGIN